MSAVPKFRYLIVSRYYWLHLFSTPAHTSITLDFGKWIIPVVRSYQLMSEVKQSVQGLHGQCKILTVS